jgi:hypothetical protein
MCFARFEAFTTVMFQVEVFWVVTPCDVAAVVSEVQAEWTSETLVSCHGTAWRRSSEDLDVRDVLFR